MADRPWAGLLASAAAGDEVAFRQIIAEHHEDMRRVAAYVAGSLRLKPNDVAILIDRLMVLFEKPSTISEHQGLAVTSELSVESLRDFIEETRGRADGRVTAARTRLLHD